MLERPDIADQNIITCLEQNYGLTVAALNFLPLGADLDTAVYQVTTRNSAAFFLKLRSGPFLVASVTVPKFLSDKGLREIITALPTISGRLWTNLDPYRVILYPFVDGRDGYERSLTDEQWVNFGRALRTLHTTSFPAAITSGVPRETFSPRWRDIVRAFLARVQQETFSETIARETAEFLNTKYSETLDLLLRADTLAAKLQTQAHDFILCHADIHAWNLLVEEGGKFYMVDWDTLIFAPKERDLMFVGGGLGGNTRSPDEEVALFYQGYGAAQVDRVALAYYRYERIIEDIAVICEHIFSSSEGDRDRRQALTHLASNFQPGRTIAIAYQTDRAMGKI